MTGGEIAIANRPVRALTLASLAVWALLTFAVPLAALTLNVFKAGQFPLGYWFASFGCLWLLAALALGFQQLAARGEHGERRAGSLTFAGEAIGAAGAIGFISAIAVHGFDGLAYPLGVVAGLALMAILVAPRFARLQAGSFADFFSLRFGGRWAAQLAAIATFFATILLVAANLRGAALAIQSLFGLDFVGGLTLAAAVLSAVLLVGFFIWDRAQPGMAFVIALVAIWILFFGTAAHLGRAPFIDIVSGAGLNDLAAVDQKLIAGKLADFKSLRPMTSPFLQMSMSSFAGIVLAVACGLAACPSLLSRHISSRSLTAGQAARRTAYAVLFVVMFLSILPALAVLLRLALETAISAGIKTSALPENIADAAALGWIAVCGAASNIADACSQMPGHRGSLRLQDVTFSGDGFALAAMRIPGIADFATVPFAVAAVAISVVAAHALLAGQKCQHHTTPETARPLKIKRIAAAGLVIAAAYAVCILGKQTITELAANGFALIASALFPSLILGLYWRKMSRAGAIAAIAVGFAVSAFYIAGSTLFPIQFFEWTGAWSNASPAAAGRLADLKVKYLLTVSTGTQKEELYAQMVQLAEPLANWFGLQKPAISLLAIPAGFLTGVVASLASKSASDNT